MVKRLSNTDQNSTKIENVPTPLAGGDAANKAYVDTKSVAAEVTVATAATTAAKIGTTAGGVYTPTLNDVVNVTFTAGSNVSNPTLNIDGSGAKNIRLGNANVTTAFVSTTSAMTLKMWYDGTYWQMYGSLKNDNTTYTEITSAEITAGTASTARAITGRRAQEIVAKAQTGVVKSSTTNRLTASDTAPSSPATGDVWLDTNDLPEELAPTSIVWKETPSGLVNGTNTNFTTAQAYISGSLQLFINGIAQSGMITESAPGSGGFTITPAPLATDNLSVQYQVRVTATGNADTVDSYHANATPTANTIPVLDGSAKLPASVMPESGTVLFNGTTARVVTLSETYTNYSRLVVVYKWVDSVGTVVLDTSSPKHNFSVVRQGLIDSWYRVQFGAGNITLSGTTVEGSSVGGTYTMNLMSGGAVTFLDTVGDVQIVKVTGVK